jgi:hypothetical protein
VPNAGFCGQRPRDEVVSADNHGEFVAERDASAGGDEGLDLDGLVAVTGQEPRRVERCRARTRSTRSAALPSCARIQVSWARLEKQFAGGRGRHIFEPGESNAVTQIRIAEQPGAATT